MPNKPWLQQKVKMEELTLEQMNWEIAVADLQDAITCLVECREALEEALDKLRKWREYN